MLTWKERKVNDIDTNPLECWYAVGFVGDSPHLYQIFPQYPNTNGDGYTVDTKLDPELYILFETLDGEHFAQTKIPERDGLRWMSDRIWDDYTFTKSAPMLVRAYRTLNDAKARAEIQISAIQGLVDTYAPKERRQSMKKKSPNDWCFLVLSWIVFGIVFAVALYFSISIMRLGAFAESEMPSMQPESGMVEAENTD